MTRYDEMMLAQLTSIAKSLKILADAVKRELDREAALKESDDRPD